MRPVASIKPTIIQDFAQLPKLLEQARAALKSVPTDQPVQAPQDEPKQLNLF